MRILDSRQIVMDLDGLGMGDAGARPLRDGDPGHARRDPRHRPHRLGQDHDSVRRPHRAEHPGPDRHHGRGPGRVRARGREAGPGEPAHRADLRHGPEGDGPRRPRRAHGRRDPRRRDGADRDRVGAHRAPGAHHAARQQRSARGRAPDRHGHRAVPRDLERGVRRGAAARAEALRVQDAGEAHEGPARRERLRAVARHHGLRARRLRALRPDRLQGSHRALRGHADDRLAPPADPRRGEPRPHPRGGTRARACARCTRTGSRRSCRASPRSPRSCACSAAAPRA